ncbi:nitroreductase family protein [Methanolobus sp. ZRKC3]|uniref:nitroreductase family protein n=1 Tax=Methanolobus sp. ZRKC3 TaxID=3125786 RepID=UPI003244497D
MEVPPMQKISIDAKECVRCGICVNVCPVNIISPGKELMDVPYIAEEAALFCSECGSCEVLCVKSCITPLFESKYANVDESNDPDIAGGQLAAYMVKRRSVRNYSNGKVGRETIESILDAVRFAPSGMNGQPVHWTIVHDTETVKKLTSLTIDWMREVQESEEQHPLKPFMPSLIAAYEAGGDPICRGAPHLAIAHAPQDNPMAYTDSIIALSWFELACPAFGLGACWAGFLNIAANSYQPIMDELDLPEGHVVQHAMMFGYPLYKIYKNPGRLAARISWK